MRFTALKALPTKLPPRRMSARVGFASLQELHGYRIKRCPFAHFRGIFHCERMSFIANRFRTGRSPSAWNCFNRRKVGQPANHPFHRSRINATRWLPRIPAPPVQGEWLSSSVESEAALSSSAPCHVLFPCKFVLRCKPRFQLGLRGAAKYLKNKSSGTLGVHPCDLAFPADGRSHRKPELEINHR